MFSTFDEITDLKTHSVYLKIKSIGGKSEHHQLDNIAKNRYGASMDDFREHKTANDNSYQPLRRKL